MKGFNWRWAGKDSPNELKRTTGLRFSPFGPMEWPSGSGRIRGAGFNLWINTPWFCVAVEWNTEEQEHEFLRDGLTFSWGRNKGWSVRHDCYYRHRCTYLSRLKKNPIDGNPNRIDLRQYNREMSH
jgi:hypothetical protein